MKNCPYCAEDIQDAAVVCRFCGRSLDGSANKECGKMNMEERSAILDEVIRKNGRSDMRIESRTSHQAVLVYGTKPNHVLHFLVGVLTCSVWWFVWLLIVLTYTEERRIITVDPDGTVDIRLPDGRPYKPFIATPTTPLSPEAARAQNRKTAAYAVGAIALLGVMFALASYADKVRPRPRFQPQTEAPKLQPGIAGGGDAYQLTNNNSEPWRITSVHFDNFRCDVGDVPAHGTVTIRAVNCKTVRGAALNRATEKPKEATVYAIVGKGVVPISATVRLD